MVKTVISINDTLLKLMRVSNLIYVTYFVKINLIDFLLKIISCTVTLPKLTKLLSTQPTGLIQINQFLCSTG